MEGTSVDDQFEMSEMGTEEFGIFQGKMML